VGGLLFRLFGILPALDGIAISLRDVVAAFGGSLIVLAALWLWNRTQKSR
jgi:drug/metabolite transporter superfamily protein YnfA